ncbi:MAG: Na+/H+ antiporter NhaC [Candidatus Hydrogenedens sp.]|jgi:NhaC family Na+:H+ antiporter|nr:Na+/H+ antiporter NhaC [Candidatus Hydrogenedens sp.]
MTTLSPPSVRLPLALLPCLFLIVLVMVNAWCFGEDASAGPNQMALLLSGVLVSTLGYFLLSLSYQEMESQAIQSIVLAMEAVLILLTVGCLIGLWILSGIVPAMIYYGIQLFTPAVFLPAACILCAIVSLAVGSSWSTMGTVGIALLGIGKALSFPDPLVAGAIVSGAYFGDKMSPLSDTTNLAPAVSGSELFSHIRHMFYTTVPSFLLALLLFTGISFFYKPGEYDDETVRQILQGINENFSVRWYLLLIPGLVIIMAARGVKAIPALTVGTLLGAATALLFQPQRFLNATGESLSALEQYKTLIATAYEGFTLESGQPIVDTLLSRGGMAAMYDTVSLILAAMFFGGAMEATGFMNRIAQAILSRVRGLSSLIASTIGSCILCNIFLSDQYLALVIPGRMFRTAYAHYKLDMRNLSRALEDGGTLTSVLVPWNTCGAFAASVLGVATFSYLPFCFFNLINPIVAIAMAGLRLGIRYDKK